MVSVKYLGTAGVRILGGSQDSGIRGGRVSSVGSSGGIGASVQRLRRPSWAGRGVSGYLSGPAAAVTSGETTAGDDDDDARPTARTIRRAATNGGGGDGERRRDDRTREGAAAAAVAVYAAPIARAATDRKSTVALDGRRRRLWRQGSRASVSRKEPGKPAQSSPQGVSGYRWRRSGQIPGGVYGYGSDPRCVRQSYPTTPYTRIRVDGIARDAGGQLRDRRSP